jgi:hypothetical protein
MAGVLNGARSSDEKRSCTRTLNPGRAVDEDRAVIYGFGLRYPYSQVAVRFDLVPSRASMRASTASPAP